MFNHTSDRIELNMEWNFPNVCFIIISQILISQGIISVSNSDLAHKLVIMFFWGEGETTLQTVIGWLHYIDHIVKLITLSNDDVVNHIRNAILNRLELQLNLLWIRCYKYLMALNVHIARWGLL